MFRKSKYMILAILMLVVLSACSSNKTNEEENSKPEVSSPLFRFLLRLGMEKRVSIF